MVPGSGLQNMPSRGETRRLRARIGLDLCPRTGAPLDNEAAAVAARTISTRIQQQVMAYSGPPDGRRGRIIHAAADAAVSQFVAIVNQEPVVPGRVDGLFAELGSGVAAAGQPLDAMHAAFDVATHTARHALEKVSGVQPRDESAAWMTHALLAYMDVLREAVVEGYQKESRRRSCDPRHLRRCLFNLVVRGESRATLVPIATRVGWPVPDEVVVLGADLEPGAVWSNPLSGTMLSRQQGRRLTVIAPSSVRLAALGEMKGLARLSPVAFTWAVNLDEVASALTWVDRALAAHTEQCIPATDEIDCANYRVVLIARSDPGLLRNLRDDLLAPLEAIPERRRQVLVETLRVWLVSHDCQKETAARLGVHPNTLDNRIRKLIELFGPRLIADAEYAASVLLAVSSNGSETWVPAA